MTHMKFCLEVHDNREGILHGLQDDRSVYLQFEICQFAVENRIEFNGPLIYYQWWQ